MTTEANNQAVAEAPVPADAPPAAPPAPAPEAAAAQPPGPPPSPQQPQEEGEREVDPFQFWVAMCSPGFVRISMHYGRIGKLELFCRQPPDQIMGFIPEQIRLIQQQVQQQTLMMVQQQQGKRGSKLLDRITGRGRK